MVLRVLESRRQPLARGETGQSCRASWSRQRRSFHTVQTTEPRSFRTRLRSVLTLSWDPFFIGTLRTGPEVGAQEDKWNFHGRDDVMVPMRKVKPAESRSSAQLLFPRRCHRGGKRGGREMSCATEGSGTSRAVTVTETEETIVNPRGRMKLSHLLQGAC